jgi:hypothetical protein
MEEGVFHVYNNWLIFNNFKLVQNQNSNFECKKWMDEFKKIQSLYTFNTKHIDNKTLLFGYQTSQQIIIPLDIFMNINVITVPKTCNNFMDHVINEIVGYFVNIIKINSNYELANELRYKLILYLPINHQDNIKIKNHIYFDQIGNNTKTTILGRILQEDHYRYDMILKFDNLWNLIPTTNKMNNVSQQMTYINGGMDMHMH